MPINTNLNKTRRYSRHTYGDDGQFGRRNILSLSFVANDLLRAAAAGTNQVLAATTVSNTAANTFLIAPNPDVPRNVVVTLAGTAASVPAGNIVINGTNVEGMVISETLALTPSSLTVPVSSKAFKSITSVTMPQATGTGVTLALGYGAKLGIGMRNIAAMPIMVWVRQSTAPFAETLEAPSASSLSATIVENNTVTTTTAQDGAKMFRVYVLNYKFAVNPTNATPDYGV